jgi:hypothetical protein
VAAGGTGAGWCEYETGGDRCGSQSAANDGWRGSSRKRLRHPVNAACTHRVFGRLSAFCAGVVVAALITTGIFRNVYKLRRMVAAALVHLQCSWDACLRRPAVLRVQPPV